MLLKGVQMYLYLGNWKLSVIMLKTENQIFFKLSVYIAGA